MAYKDFASPEDIRIAIRSIGGSSGVCSLFDPPMNVTFPTSYVIKHSHQNLTSFNANDTDANSQLLSCGILAAVSVCTLIAYLLGRKCKSHISSKHNSSNQIQMNSHDTTQREFELIVVPKDNAHDNLKKTTKFLDTISSISSEIDNAIVVDNLVTSPSSTIYDAVALRDDPNYLEKAEEHSL